MLKTHLYIVVFYKSVNFGSSCVSGGRRAAEEKGDIVRHPVNLLYGHLCLTRGHPDHPHPVCGFLRDRSHRRQTGSVATQTERRAVSVQRTPRADGASGGGRSSSAAAGDVFWCYVQSLFVSFLH